MEDRFIFNAIVTGYYYIDTPNEYKEVEPQIYLHNIDVFSDEIGIDYDRLLAEVEKQLKLDKPEISQVMQFFEDNSNASDFEYVTIKPDKVLQCTGQKDKNGKLICEGDIVKFNYDTDEIKAVVSWDDIELIGFYLNTTDYFKDKYVTDYDFYKNDYEVIGNIYQNPELLED